MEIDLKNLNEKIAQQDYLQDLETVKYADISKSKARVKELASKMVQETATAIKHGSLSHVALEVNGQRPVTFALESNIINLPYSNYKKVANFFEEGKNYPVFVYFETQSEYLNASGFRIDQLATEEELMQDEAGVIAKLAEAIGDKLQHVREYEKPAAPTKKKVEAKKTAKKTAPVKTKTRRTATKKGTKTKKK